MSTAQEIRCSHFGAPVEFRPGEIIVTCKYCAYTTVIENGRGFLKPPDLARKPKILAKPLIYLPFWILSGEAKCNYKGVRAKFSSC